VLTFLVLGFFQGAVYGLLAVGLVLVYKGTRVFNFAQGEFGTIAAYITLGLFANANVPYGIAVILALAATVAIGLIVERVVIRPLLEAPRITVLVATVGIALFIIALMLLIAKPELRTLDPLVAGDPFILWGAAVEPQSVLILLFMGLLALAVWWFFNRTDRGLAVLATSQDPFATRVVGISVPGMSRFIWGAAAFLGGIAGILQAGVSTTLVAPAFMTTGTLLPAFTGAVLGGMTSLPGAFIGGEIVGIAQNVLGAWAFQDKAGIAGGPNLAVFGVLLVILLIRPQGLLGKET
jgi:branched-chain amino acid transport system permease protein